LPPPLPPPLPSAYTGRLHTENRKKYVRMVSGEDGLRWGWEGLGSKEDDKKRVPLIFFPVPTAEILEDALS
jgi:hypothetical protein